MATLRLFAQAREAAGTAQVTVDATTVGGVLAVAVERFGPPFAEVLAASRVWLNGDPTDDGAAVATTDEVAVLPPVSGGA